VVVKEMGEGEAVGRDFGAADLVDVFFGMMVLRRGDEKWEADSKEDAWGRFLTGAVRDE
jgi:hypothetical protein